MKVLALHTSLLHDTGAAVLEGPRVLAAVNEERLTRRKNDAAFPERSVAEALRISGVAPRNLDAVLLSGIPSKFGKAMQFATVWLRYLRLLGPGYLRTFLRPASSQSIITARMVPKALGDFRRTAAAAASLKAQGFTGAVRYVLHHTAHLASAYYPSGFPANEPVLVVNVEGSSFKHTLNLAVGEQGKLLSIADTPDPISAGRFYEAATVLCGFTPNRHEGKVTGLAARGDPSRFRAVVAPLLGRDSLALTVSREVYAWPQFYLRTGRLPEPLAGTSREDIAAAFQERLETVLLGIIGEALQRTGARHVALAGGVAANVRLNGKIAALPEVEQLFIQPGMGDVGQAVGCGWADWAAGELAAGRTPEPFRLDDVFWGPEFTDAECRTVLEHAGLPFSRPPDISAAVAGLLAAGRVVARFSGRMEFGPRALGNRSILYRPDDPSVNDWLNKKLDRSEFMPFAPIVLAEDAPRCFVGISKIPDAARFMTVALPVTPEFRRECPGVVHKDGTARPQVVDPTLQPDLADILRSYRERTGLPALINTSFNLHEEPIVCTPEDAVRAFTAAGLDALLLGPYLVEKS